MVGQGADYECMFLIAKDDYEAFLQQKQREGAFNQVNNIEVGHGGNVVIREEGSMPQMPQNFSSPTSSFPPPSSSRHAQPTMAAVTAKPTVSSTTSSSSKKSLASSSSSSSTDGIVANIQKKLDKMPSDPSQREMSTVPLEKKRRKKVASKKSKSKSSASLPQKRSLGKQQAMFGKSSRVDYRRKMGQEEGKTPENMEATPLGRKLPQPLPDDDVEMEDLSSLDMVETVKRAREIRKREEEERKRSKGPKKPQSVTPDTPMETDALSPSLPSPTVPMPLPRTPETARKRVDRGEPSPLPTEKGKRARQVSPSIEPSSSASKSKEEEEKSKSKGEAKKRSLSPDLVAQTDASKKLHKASDGEGGEREQEMDAVYSRLQQLKRRRGAIKRQREEQQRQQQQQQQQQQQNQVGSLPLPLSNQRLQALSYDPRDIVYRPPNAAISREEALLGLRAARKRKFPSSFAEEEGSSGSSSKRQMKELTFRQLPAIEYIGESAAPHLPNRHEIQEPQEEDVERVLAVTWEPERSKLKRKRVETKLAKSQAESLAPNPKKGRDSLIFPAKRKNPFSSSVFEPRKAQRVREPSEQGERGRESEEEGEEEN
jgi:hypothetical protein